VGYEESYLEARRIILQNRCHGTIYDLKNQSTCKDTGHAWQFLVQPSRAPSVLQHQGGSVTVVN
jgi:hypothetical protein